MSDCVYRQMIESIASERTAPSTAEKVRFLTDPTSYPHRPDGIESVETHFAWIFFAGPYAYKLKKPISRGSLDLRTLAARERDCRDELRLNKRLARDIYLQVLPLCIDEGGLRIENDGRPVDWLVKMRRLPASRMLDTSIRKGTLRPEELRPVVEKLVLFYRHAPRPAMSADRYTERLIQRIDQNHSELTKERFGLNTELVERACAAQRAWLNKNSEVVAQRVHDGRIVEAHGDLRPEHIFLGDPSHPEPAIIDCLEFSRDLRILDCVDELAFLALECERLDAAAIGATMIQCYRECSGDVIPEPLLHFYKSLRAGVRATLSVWHLLDPDTGPAARWTRQATDYLRAAQRYLD